jgi:2-polyprenyl-6-methoxyphenol hydroxylase-like FAD-dependent oxidoreductase
MFSDHPATHDVIIAGAGPVGLFLACELRLAGCSVLVLEQAADPDQRLRALPFGLRGLTLSTIDSLDRRGLLTPLMRQADANGGAAAVPWTAGARRPGGHFAGLPFFSDQIDEAAWPWRSPAPAGMMAVTMADLEVVLTARAMALGVTIRRDCGVTSFENLRDGVLVHAGGVGLRASWLVGCDGARSTVRKGTGIGFAGTEPEFTGYSLSLLLANPQVLSPGRRYTASGMYTYAPPGTVTMIDFDGGACHRTGALSCEHVEGVLRRVSGTEASVTAINVGTTWTDRAFLANTYSSDRVFLAGDAAHIHAPLGGQGLNLGLGDAMNLGWKLAAVISGRAPPTLLDSYQKERRPVAEQVLDWSRAQVALLRPDPGTAALRAIVRDLIATREGATYVAGRVWGAALRYECDEMTGPLVGRSAPDVTLEGGQRLNDALREGRAILLDLDPMQPLRGIAADWGERLDYRTAPSKSDSCDALLIRADGVVAWAGSKNDVNGLLPALARWIGDQPLT